MYKITGRIRSEDFGWYFAKVHSQLKTTEKKDNPECTHWAKFDVKESPENQILLDAWQPTSKRRDMVIAISTSEESRGTRWVLLKDASRK